MPVVHNGVETYQPDQLLVEQRDSNLVQEELRRLGVAASQLDSSDALRLSLLGLSDVESAAAVLRQDSALVESASRAQESSGQAAAVVGDLEVVVFALRRSMRAAYDGWQAVVAKNQILGRVQDSPYIKGGVGEPDRADPVSIPPVPRQAGARVAVLDTKLFAHPDLAGRFLGDSVPYPGPGSRSTPGQELRSTQGHSTFVAGLIAQRAPGVEIIVRAVLDDDGANPSSWDVATQMVGFLDAGVAVLNLSFGCATIDRVAPLSLCRAVERLIPSVVVVAAAGNNGIPTAQAAASGLTATTPIYPAAIEGVISVGAYDPAEGTVQPAALSSVGPTLSLLAPGVRVRSTFLPGEVRLVHRDPDGQLAEDGTADFGQPGYARWDGTSFAAANVTGALAALMVAGQVSAYEALELLRNPATAGGDILPWGPG
jgi:subtilisin family serine protease